MEMAEVDEDVDEDVEVKRAEIPHETENDLNASIADD